MWLLTSSHLFFIVVPVQQLHNKQWINMHDYFSHWINKAMGQIIFSDDSQIRFGNFLHFHYYGGRIIHQHWWEGNHPVAHSGALACCSGSCSSKAWTCSLLWLPLWQYHESYNSWYHVLPSLLQVLLVIRAGSQKQHSSPYLNSILYLSVTPFYRNTGFREIHSVANFPEYLSNTREYI